MPRASIPEQGSGFCGAVPSFVGLSHLFGDCPICLLHPSTFGGAEGPLSVPAVVKWREGSKQGARAARSLSKFVLGFQVSRTRPARGTLPACIPRAGQKRPRCPVLGNDSGIFPREFPCPNILPYLLSRFPCRQPVPPRVAVSNALLMGKKCSRWAREGSSQPAAPATTCSGHGAAGPAAPCKP